MVFRSQAVQSTSRPLRQPSRVELDDDAQRKAATGDTISAHQGALPGRRASSWGSRPSAPATSAPAAWACRLARRLGCQKPSPIIDSLFIIFGLREHEENSSRAFRRSLKIGSAAIGPSGKTFLIG